MLSKSVVLNILVIASECMELHNLYVFSSEILTILQNTSNFTTLVLKFHSLHKLYNLFLCVE